MYDQPQLSESEWALVIELLREERDELPAEIHHTQTAEYRENLRRRLAMVDGLLERLREPTPAV